MDAADVLAGKESPWANGCNGDAAYFFRQFKVGIVPKVAGDGAGGSIKGQLFFGHRMVEGGACCALLKGFWQNILVAFQRIGRHGIGARGVGGRRKDFFPHQGRFPQKDNAT